MVLVDCVARLVPGVLGNPESIKDESFSRGLLSILNIHGRRNMRDILYRKFCYQVITGD